jgi:hypothetical protein
MTTISTVCANLFTQTTLSDLPKSDRGTRRNLARVIYRESRRPGIVNPGEPGERPARDVKAKTSRGVKPMRHVYKLRVPDMPKPGTLKSRLRMGMIPRLARMSRSLTPVGDTNV